MVVRQPMLGVPETPQLLAHHKGVTEGRVPKELPVPVALVVAAGLLKLAQLELLSAVALGVTEPHHLFQAHPHPTLEEEEEGLITPLEGPVELEVAALAMVGQIILEPLEQSTLEAAVEAWETDPLRALLAQAAQES